MRHVLHILKVVVEAGAARLPSSDKLVLEEDDMMLMVLTFTLMTAGHLTLIAREDNLVTVMLGAVRLRRRVLLARAWRSMDMHMVGLAVNGVLVATRPLGSAWLGRSEQLVRAGLVCGWIDQLDLV